MINTRNNHHGHDHGYRDKGKRRLIISLSITASVMVLEIIGGIFTQSIALISDGGHMFTHSFAITISLVAIILAQRPRTTQRTFGLYRAEVLAAFTNGLFLIPVAAYIIYESIVRILNPEKILSIEMLIIAFIGLAVNLASMLLLRGSRKESMNIRSVFFHVLTDLISSIGIVIAAVIIYFTDWYILDPIVGIGISLLIFYWSFGLIRDSSKILLEIAPKGLDPKKITNRLKKRFPEIKEVSNIHIWTITGHMNIFSAHVRLDDGLDTEKNRLLDDMDIFLRSEFEILETTIQLKEG